MPTFTIGERIRKKREALGWSQGFLADRAKVHRLQVSQYETDRIEPKLGNLGRIAAAMGIGLDELMGLAKKKAR